MFRTRSNRTRSTLCLVMRLGVAISRPAPMELYGGGLCCRVEARVFFPPVWPIRTRHGPYNSVSGEKHLEKGLVWSKTAGKSSHQHKQTNQKTQPKTTRKSPSQICVSPKSKTAKQQRTGPGPNKNQTKQLEICLEYSDLSHCIVIKNMQTN